MNGWLKESLEMRGLRREVLVDYFISIGCLRVKLNQFQGNGWKVRIDIEYKIHLGSITLPVVPITFGGVKDTALPLLHSFRMHFLSAGG